MNSRYTREIDMPGQRQAAHRACTVTVFGAKQSSHPLNVPSWINRARLVTIEPISTRQSSLKNRPDVPVPKGLKSRLFYSFTAILIEDNVVALLNKH